MYVAVVNALKNKIKIIKRKDAVLNEIQHSFKLHADTFIIHIT